MSSLKKQRKKLTDLRNPRTTDLPYPSTYFWTVSQ